MVNGCCMLGAMFPIPLREENLKTKVEVSGYLSIPRRVLILENNGGLVHGDVTNSPALTTRFAVLKGDSGVFSFIRCILNYLLVFSYLHH